MQRVTQTIDTLCSSSFFGRGYTQEGAGLAAEYLVQQYKEIGLSAFSSQTYEQAFTLDVNTYPSACVLQIDKQLLQLGIDFIPHAASASGAAKGRLLRLDTLSSIDAHQLDSLLKTHASLEKSIIALDAAHEALFRRLSRQALQQLFSAKAILFRTPKLTHSLAPFQYPTPCFKVQSDVFNALSSHKEKVTFEIEAQLLQSYTAWNVVGYVPGTIQPDSFVVYTAHYDHLGGIGKEVYFPGANDNASGVAMLLELAHWYQRNPPTHSVAFIAFGGEEAGLVGSRFYTENPFFPLERIKVLFNLDLFATGEKGATFVNGSIFKEDFEQFVAANQNTDLLTNIAARGEAANSDHYFFYKNGVKCFFIYLQGEWPHYHDVNDHPPVPLSEFQDSFKLLLALEQLYR